MKQPTDVWTFLSLIIPAFAFLVGLAGFLYKWILDVIESKRKQNIAGNLALATIAQYSRDLEHVKQQFKERRKEFSSEELEAHPWVQIMLGDYLLSEPVRINHEALIFLIRGKSSDEETFASIITSEQRHRDLNNLLCKITDMAEKFFSKLEVENTINDLNPLKKVESTTGPLLTAQITRHINAIWQLLNEEPNVHRRAYDQLRNSMARKFREKDIFDFDLEIIN